MRILNRLLKTKVLIKTKYRNEKINSSLKATIPNTEIFINYETLETISSVSCNANINPH